MATSFTIQVITQEKSFDPIEADSVTIDTEAGQITVMPGHIPLFSRLKAGQVHVRYGNKQELMYIAGGFVDVSPHRVKILADTAVRAEEIDEAKVKQAKEDAERAMSDKVSREDFLQAEASMRRALLELETLNKWRRLKSTS